jgi:hypothetical protein
VFSPVFEGFEALQDPHLGSPILVSVGYRGPINKY